LLLLTVAKPRKIQRDGLRLLGYRYMDPTLAAYVGESVILRYDPRDMAEVRVFYRDRFLCRAICQDLAGATIPLREILRARNRHPRRPPSAAAGPCPTGRVAVGRPSGPSERGGEPPRGARGDGHRRPARASPPTAQALYQ